MIRGGMKDDILISTENFLRKYAEDNSISDEISTDILGRIDSCGTRSYLIKTLNERHRNRRTPPHLKDLFMNLKNYVDIYLENYIKNMSHLKFLKTYEDITPLNFLREIFYDDVDEDDEPMRQVAKFLSDVDDDDSGDDDDDRR